MQAPVLAQLMIPRFPGAMSSDTAAADPQQPSKNALGKQPATATAQKRPLLDEGAVLCAHSGGVAMGSMAWAAPISEAAPIGLLPPGGQRPQMPKLASTGPSLLQLWAASSLQRQQNAPMLPPLAGPGLARAQPNLPSSSEPGSRGLSGAAALLPAPLASSAEAPTRVSSPALLDSGSAALRGAQQPREELAPVSSSDQAPVFSGASTAHEAQALARLGPSLAMHDAQHARGAQRWPSASEGQACLRRPSAAAWEGGLLQCNREDAPGQHALGGVAHTALHCGAQAMHGRQPQSGLVPSAATQHSLKRSAAAALQGLPFKIQRTTSGADSACAASASSSPEVGSQSQRKASALPPTASRERAVKDSWARATSGVAAMVSDGAPAAPLAPPAGTASQCQQPNRGAWGGLGASLGLNQQLLDTLQLKIAASSERASQRDTQEGQDHVTPKPSESQASLGSLNTGAILALCRSRKDCGTCPIVAPGAAGPRHGAQELGLTQERGPAAHAAQSSPAAGSSGLVQAAAAPGVQPEASWSEPAVPETAQGGAAVLSVRSATPGSTLPVGQVKFPPCASPLSWDCNLFEGARSREDGAGFSLSSARHEAGSEPAQELGVAWEDDNQWGAMDEEGGGDEALRGAHGAADKSRIATERQRRQRIRDGLELLRSTVSGQGDNAAMLRQAVDYIRSLRAEVGQLQARVNRAKAPKE